MNEFNRDNRYAESPEIVALWDSIYRQRFPDMVNYTRFSGKSIFQTRGIDTILFLSNGKQLAVDEKTRREDHGDFLMERYSDQYSDGWVFASYKTIDWIAYLIVPSRKVYWLPFALLRATCRANEKIWCVPERKIIAVNEGYETINYSVQWAELWAAMYKNSIQTIS